MCLPHRLRVALAEHRAITTHDHAADGGIGWTDEARLLGQGERGAHVKVVVERTHGGKERGRLNELEPWILLRMP